MKPLMIIKKVIIPEDLFSAVIGLGLKQMFIFAVEKIRIA